MEESLECCPRVVRTGKVGSKWTSKEHSFSPVTFGKWESIWRVLLK
jgi:hypothetical protein